MTITIDFPSEVEEKIRKQAIRQDMKIEDYVVMIIEEELQIREKDGIKDENRIEVKKL